MSSAPRKKERSSDGSTRIVCKLPGCEKPSWPNDRELETARTYHHQRYHQESARIVYQGRSVEIRRDPATGRFPCPCGEPQHARRMAINTRTLCRPQVHPPPDTPSAGEAATDDEGFGYRRATGTQSSGGAGSLSSAGAGSLSSGGSGSQSFSEGTRSAQSGRTSAGGTSYQPPAAESNAKSTANAAGRTRSAASASTSAPMPASASVSQPTTTSVPKPTSASVPKRASTSASAPLPRKRRRGSPEVIERRRGSPEVIEVGSDSEDGGPVVVKRVKRVKREPGSPTGPSKRAPAPSKRPIRRTVSASPSPDAGHGPVVEDEDKVEADDDDIAEVDDEDKIEVNDEDKVEAGDEDKVEIGDEDGEGAKDESGAMEQTDEEDRGPREEARARRPQTAVRASRPQKAARAGHPQKAVRADRRRRDEAAPAAGHGDAAPFPTGKGSEGAAPKPQGDARPPVEDAAPIRRGTKTERELTLEEKFERNKALERKLHEQLDKQYEAYQEKLRAMEALMS